MSIKSILKKHSWEHRKEDMMRRASRCGYEVRSNNTKRLIAGLKSDGHMIPANAIDYAIWLKGYLEGGGRITNTYDYNMPDDECYLATESFEIPDGACGALSFNVIVCDPDIQVTEAGHSHCQVYRLDYTNEPQEIHLYKDVARILQEAPDDTN